MKGNIVAPLSIGFFAGVAGAMLAALAGAHWLLCILAYSLCGAVGLLGAAVLHLLPAGRRPARSFAERWEAGG